MSKKPSSSDGDGQRPLTGNQRWSLRRKQEVVMRLLHGEPLDAVSRAVGVEVYRLEQWREKALLGMAEGLRDRTGDPLQDELDKAMQRIGELSMENELMRREREAHRPFPRKRCSK